MQKQLPAISRDYLRKVSSMSTNIGTSMLSGVTWYRDQDALSRGEPGVVHSYMASLATAIGYLDGSVDPVWLMGAGGFAFRINVNETLCPSAMSVFDWRRILPAAVENTGRSCLYIDRLWEDGDKEAERREEARLAIVKQLDQGRPAIVWDVQDAEWGLVVGIDARHGVYQALGHNGETVELPVERLGRNGIDVLSVAIPTEPNERTREEAVTQALRAALAHAEQKEWMDRPAYQDGLKAYDLWATIFDRGVLLVQAGKAGNVSPDIPSFMRYYARHYYSARCYAREFLKRIADDNCHLKQAASAYSRVAAALGEVWKMCKGITALDSANTLSQAAERIREAQTAEGDGLRSIRRYLEETA